MRILTALLSLFLLLACKPEKTVNVPSSPPPTIKKEIGIYKNATIYTGRSDYEFEINGKSILVRVSNTDNSNRPNIPSNLDEPNPNGVAGPNPLLIGAKYTLEFGPNDQVKAIYLADDHDPSNVELPAIPEDYSGLLAVAPTAESRAYLHLSSDLMATLLIQYEPEQAPIVRYGRWNRSQDGHSVIVQLEEEQWDFLVRENALVLRTRQMGSAGLSLLSTEDYTICDYVRTWLSDLSTIDREKRVLADDIDSEMPLAEVLRTEHAYMNLYSSLETTFKVDEETTANALRQNPTIQGVCDLVLHYTEERH